MVIPQKNIQMTTTLILASNNPHKVEEINRMIPSSWALKIKSLKDIGFTEDIAETADTLEGNAFIKSNHIFKKLDCNVFSEDTGLEVEALNGAPGVYTARYGGPEKNADQNMDKLLAELQNKANRKARFRTIISIFWEGVETQFEGIVNGTISSERKGDGGFGYDPIFIPDGYTKSFAELPSEIKNEISHRARATLKLFDFLRQKLAI